MSYENYVKFRDALGLRDIDVARRSGVTQATFPQWKKGQSEPKIEKRRKIAEVLGISVDQLDGIEPQPEYYIDAETRRIVDEMQSNKDYRVMFKAIPRLKPEDARMIRDMIERLLPDDYEP